MTANVSIVIAERLNALRLANSALRVRIPEDCCRSPRQPPRRAEPEPAPRPRPRNP